MHVAVEFVQYVQRVDLHFKRLPVLMDIWQAGGMENNTYTMRLIYMRMEIIEQLRILHNRFGGFSVIDSGQGCLRQTHALNSITINHVLCGGLRRRIAIHCQITAYSSAVARELRTSFD